jgi:SAM-dependent methyltransferase
MSRKYLNDKYCVRCGRHNATPYLRSNKKFIDSNCKTTDLILDIGCGNGRNTNFLRQSGFSNIKSIDMVADYGQKCILGKDALPCKGSSVKLILANYVFMFLDKKELEFLLVEIDRVASHNAVIICELYAAKDCEYRDLTSTMSLQKYIFNTLGWEKIRYSKQRFVARRW